MCGLMRLPAAAALLVRLVCAVEGWPWPLPAPWLSARGELLSPSISVHPWASPLLLLDARRSHLPETGIVVDPQMAADPTAAIVYLPVGHSADSISSMAFYVRNVAEVAYVTESAVMYYMRFYNGSVLTWHRDTQYQWLDGSFGPSSLTNGLKHICALHESGYAECRGSTDEALAQFPGALLLDRSHVAFAQVSAGHIHTCALRRNDSRVECGGKIVDGIGLITLNLTTTEQQYASIAAQFYSGFCGVRLEQRDLWCWSAFDGTEQLALPAPTLPLFFKGPMVTSNDYLIGCALVSDGSLQCAGGLDSFPLPVPPAQEPQPIAQVAHCGTDVDIMFARTSRLMFYTRNWYEPTTFRLFIFSPIRLVVVDPLDGDDQRCSDANSMEPASLAALIPCRTLAHAITVASAVKSWLLLLEGVHSAGDLTFDYGMVTIASVPLRPFRMSSWL